MILRNRSACRGVRRFGYLLASTALVSIGFLSEAAAVCNVTPAGTVDCVTNTTTTLTVNFNGAIAASSDGTQAFSNGSSITGTIGNGVVIDGTGLNLQLSNPGGNNTIVANNNGLVSTSSDLVTGAFFLFGNGALVVYEGTGSVINTSTASFGRGLVARNSGAGTVVVFVNGGTVQSASSDAVDVVTAGGAVTLQGAAGTGTVIGRVGASLTSNGGPMTVVNLALVHGTNGNAILASTGGGVFNVAGNAQIIGSGNVAAIDAVTDGGNINIVNNGTISGGLFLNATGPGAGAIAVSGNSALTAPVGINGVSVFAGSGGTVISGNGNISGLFAQTEGGPLTIQGNGNITSLDGDGVFVLSLGGPLNIGGVVPNGSITGATNGVLAFSDAGSLTLVTGGAITGQTQTGITAAGSGGLSLTLNHNVTGGTNGLQLGGPSGDINVHNAATITGGMNAIVGSTADRFNVFNTGTINGALNFAGGHLASGIDNSGTWNTGTGNSTVGGGMFNTGILNAQNGVAGQTIAFSTIYFGGGVVRLDLGDRLQFGGIATLTGGTLNVVLAPNSPLSQTNVVLTAAGGLGGTTFATTSVAIPNATVTYTPTQVIVSVPSIQLGAGSNLNQNQQNVATSINNFFNGGGTLPGPFAGLLNLTGPAVANALSQLSGEVATGLQPSANLSMGMFLNAMIDPFVTGRSGGFGSAVNYAPETPSRVEVAAHEAFAADMPVKARLPVATFEQRWSIWGAAYGGQNRTDGDLVVGSNDLRASAGGFAAGADYRVSRDTVMGMAVAVGQTRWNVAAPALGKGHSDVGQIGGYASTRWDNLYLSAALAFAWHRAATERTVTIAGTDRLEADIDATSIGGRLEGGYRFGGVQYGFTPYAAVQVQSLHTPGYSEFATQGVNQFALTFASQTTTDTRSELGFWADTRFPFADNTVVLRGRVAWVHDYNPGSRINPAFQGLPGASFTVNGAAAPSDAALTSAVAEIRLRSGWQLISKIDGEFSGRSTTVTGTGTARYTW